MANLYIQASDEAVLSQRWRAWYIELTWPDGCIEHIDSFQSESEINDWISRKSDAWLKARGK
jgi:hypothetical protein